MVYHVYTNQKSWCENTNVRWRFYGQKHYYRQWQTFYNDKEINSPVSYSNSKFQVSNLIASKYTKQ